MNLCLPPKGDIFTFIRKIQDLTPWSRIALKEEIVKVLRKLQDWWSDFTKEESSLIVYSGAGSSHIAESIQPQSEAESAFPDTLTAKSVSLYNSLIIIVHSVLVALDDCQKGLLQKMSLIQAYHSVIRRHSASILTAAAYQNWRHAYCGDALRTGFSLQILAVLGIDKEHREEALKKLELLGMESWSAVGED